MTDETSDLPRWHDSKTIAEIIHEYAVVRGDLTEQYARDQLVDILTERILREVEQRIKALPEWASFASALRVVRDMRDEA